MRVLMLCQFILQKKNGKEIVHELKIKKTCTSFHRVLKSGGREETY